MRQRQKQRVGGRDLKNVKKVRTGCYREGNRRGKKGSQGSAEDLVKADDH